MLFILHTSKTIQPQTEIKTKSFTIGGRTRREVVGGEWGNQWWGGVRVCVYVRERWRDRARAIVLFPWVVILIYKTQAPNKMWQQGKRVPKGYTALQTHTEREREGSVASSTNSIHWVYLPTTPLHLDGACLCLPSVVIIVVLAWGGTPPANSVVPSGCLHRSIRKVRPVNQHTHTRPYGIAAGGRAPLWKALTHTSHKYTSHTHFSRCTRREGQLELKCLWWRRVDYFWEGVFNVQCFECCVFLPFVQCIFCLSLQLGISLNL